MVEDTRGSEPDGDGLWRCGANRAPLNPVSLLLRTAQTYPGKTAVVHGDRRYTYAQFHDRCVALAAALAARGIGPGDRVAILAPNVPAMLEAHFGVLMVGAVLNALNTRLDPPAVAFCLAHGGARLLLADTELGGIARQAVASLEAPIPIVDIADLPEFPRVGEIEYEDFLATGAADFVPRIPEDEWHSVSLLYTSGTTGNPKGVVYHARGAYLNALSNALMSELNSRTVYLWTLPLFHCNGWTYPWAVTAVGGTHVCLRRVEAGAVFDLIGREGVTQMHGAPIVLNLLIHARPEEQKPLLRRVDIGVGGAAPPSTVIARMEALGFRVTHLYGTTESYGPASICAWQEGWEDLPGASRAALMARQGVRMLAHEALIVADPVTLQPVPRDGATLGEVLLRGNAVMKGYFKNGAATAGALAGGYYHTGDIAVWHPDGYIEVKDRSKDIIISGGENISSLEVEEALYRHPAIMEAAVVAAPDAKWGEVPCAFVTLRPGGAAVGADEIIAFCRERLAHFKCPRYVVFGPLVKTATGKVQKFQLRDTARRQLATAGEKE